MSNVGSSYAELHDVLLRSKHQQAIKKKAANKSSLASSPRKPTEGETLSTQRNADLGGVSMLSRRVKNHSMFG